MTTHSTYTATADTTNDEMDIFAKSEADTGDAISEAGVNLAWHDVEGSVDTTTSSQRLTTTSENVVSWSGDGYEINTLAQAYDASDKAYVPIVHERVPWGSSTVQLSNSLIWSTTIRT